MKLIYARLALLLLKKIAERTDNKIDDQVVDAIEKLIEGKKLTENDMTHLAKAGLRTWSWVKR